MLVISLSVLALGGCRWLLQEAGPVPIVVRSESVGLSWDPRDQTVPDLSSSVDHYRVYYRPYGTAQWVFLNATSGTETSTSITRGALDFGTYEFGVREVYRNGSHSAIHGSSDFTAWPPGGWYLVWQEP